MKKILSFGSLNIDYVYLVDHFVRPGETIKSKDVSVFCGGKGLNQSIALSKAGANVYHAGAVGIDGNILIDNLSSNNIDIRFLKKMQGQSGNAIIQIDDSGENCIILYEGTNGSITKEHIDEVIEHFSDGDYIVLQNEINHLGYIMERAHDKKMKIVLNPSPMNEGIHGLPLHLVDYFILNEIEALDMLDGASGDLILEKFSERFNHAHIVLTLGSKGVKYQYEDQTFQFGVYKTNIIDTTAAGDTFTGYFVSEIAKGTSEEDSIIIASKAAAIAIATKGASNSIPNIDVVMKSQLEYIN